MNTVDSLKQIVRNGATFAERLAAYEQVRKLQRAARATEERERRAAMTLNEWMAHNARRS